MKRIDENLKSATDRHLPRLGSAWLRGEEYRGDLENRFSSVFERFSFGFRKCDFTGENGKKFGLFGLVRFLWGAAKTELAGRSIGIAGGSGHIPARVIYWF
jgi:hypothetical protein